MFIACHVGGSRIVLVLPFLGIAIKFPRVRLVNMARLMWSKFEGKPLRVGFRRALLSLFRYDVDTLWAPKWLLFKGFVDNWREWRFSGEFHHPVVARTHLFLGVTVQVYAKPLSFCAEEMGKDGLGFARRFLPIIGDEIARDAHHFENPQNFGVMDGHLVVVDYASPTVQAILRTYADDLVHSFRVT